MAQEWKKSRVRAILTALFAAILCGGVFMGTAFAYNTASYWNTSGTPLETSSYGSTAKAYRIHQDLQRFQRHTAL
jgi:hypothetical protein